MKQAQDHNVLPETFRDLETWKDWILDNETARHQHCRGQNMERIQAFYDALLPRMDAIITHLNQFPLVAMPDAENRLLKLALAFTEAAMSVEMFEQADMPYGMTIEQFQPQHHLVPRG